MIQVKICGINDAAGFDAAVDAGADWLGFNFFPRSPRYVTPQAAASLSARAAGGPTRVGLFVEPTIVAIESVLAQVGLDVLQIYGADALFCEIKTRFGLPLWRAVGIAAAADLPTGPGGAARLVLESKPPAEADRPGGNARRFDWSLLRNWPAPTPWILAGGLTPANVAAAIAATSATAVDVSSGVERLTGVKDPTLIHGFIQAVRDAEV